MRLGRSFAIASKPVTFRQFLKFKSTWRDKTVREFAPDEDCPVNRITWAHAANYCNWLSEKEGIPAKEWCYEFNRDGKVAKLKANYLSLEGHRLPTDAGDGVRLKAARGHDESLLR